MTSKSETLAAAMGAVSRGDIDQFGQILLSGEIVWHWPGRSSMAGDYRGRAAALDLVRGFHRLTGGRLSVEPIDILEGTDHVMSFTRIRAQKEGHQLDVTMADAMRFGPDGRVVEYWTLSNDQDAVDAFLG